MNIEHNMICFFKLKNNDKYTRNMALSESKYTLICLLKKKKIDLLLSLLTFSV